MKLYLPGVMRSCFVHASHSINAARTRHTRFLSIVVGLCAGLMLGGAQAAFQAVETFDRLALDNISGQNGWVASAGSLQRVVARLFWTLGVSAIRS